MTTLSDLIAMLRINPDLPDDVVMAVPPRHPRESNQQLAKRSVLITNVAALKAREARR